GHRVGIVEIEPRVLVVAARVDTVDRQCVALHDLALYPDARGPRFRRVRLWRAHGDARRGALRGASREGVGITGIDNHRLDRALRGGDIQLDVQEALIDVMAVAAAHRGLAVVERIPDDAEP